MKQTIIFLDFDGSIAHSPEPETGRAEYLAKTGKPFPHIGWWSKDASLNLDVFDIKLIESVDAVFQKASKDPAYKTVLLTNRQYKMESAVRKVLDHHNYKMDLYTFKSGVENKGNRIVNILQMPQFKDVTDAEFYDDDAIHLDDAERCMLGSKVSLKLFLVKDGNIVPYN